MQSSGCADLYSKYFPFWGKLTEDEKSLLCRHTSETSYKKGDNIHGHSGDCTGVIFIKSGCLRTYILSEDGKEVTLYRLYSGDICMLSASCVFKSITFDVFVDAETDCEIFVINGNTFAQVSDNNIFVQNFALSIAVDRFSEVMWAMQQILFMSFDKRLAVFLIDELSKSGGDTVNMTHEQIAKYMGSAREVVSRMLKYFTSEGIVECSRGDIKVIDKAKLRKLAM